MRRNLRSGFPRRARTGHGLDAYDRLPAPLRRWLAQAALPWSPHSAQRLWRRALDESGGDVARALARLDAAEARQLTREPGAGRLVGVPRVLKSRFSQDLHHDCGCPRLDPRGALF